jgi:hypothetical protein
MMILLSEVARGRLNIEGQEGWMILKRKIIYIEAAS